jgi:hypothetical protein
MMGGRLFGTMQTHHSAIEAWCDVTWGERPVRISDWAVHDDIVQVFLRLSASVLIADFTLGANGRLSIQQHLHIPLETWNPGSIQGLRTMEGKTRFQHRRQSILLSSELRVPEWGAALLEEWLMSMRGAVNRPKDKVQRTNEIKRMQLSVQRNLESAGLSNVQSEIKALDERVDRVDARLAN